MAMVAVALSMALLLLRAAIRSCGET